MSRPVKRGRAATVPAHGSPGVGGDGRPPPCPRLDLSRGVHLCSESPTEDRQGQEEARATMLRRLCPGRSRAARTHGNARRDSHATPEPDCGQWNAGLETLTTTAAIRRGAGAYGASTLPPPSIPAPELGVSAAAPRRRRQSGAPLTASTARSRLPSPPGTDDPFAAWGCLAFRAASHPVPGAGPHE